MKKDGIYLAHLIEFLKSYILTEREDYNQNNKAEDFSRAGIKTQQNGVPSKKYLNLPLKRDC